MFKNKRVVYVDDVREMNKHLRYCHKNLIEAPSEDWVNEQRIKTCYFTLDLLYTRVILRYAGNGNYYTEYIFQLDGSEHAQAISGLRTFTLLQRMSNKGVVDLTNNWNLYDSNYDRWKIETIGGLIYFNPKYINGRYENCIEYDKRSAYAHALMQPIPDTKVQPRRNDIVRKGEIGFKTTAIGYSEEENLYAIFEEGKPADYIFPAIESPFKNFAQYYFNKRKNAKGREADRVKQILNYSIGYIRRKNPFIHSCILSRARFDIESLIDENTLYSNTDSLVSLVPRLDLADRIGDNIGEFRVQHKGSFAYTTSGYQWNKDQPSIRGKSKSWFKKAYPNGFDILHDELPFMESNIYYYDREKGVIRKCQEEKEDLEVQTHFQNQNA